MISKDSVFVLKTAFLIGAVVDGLIAIEWFLISLGLVDLPVHPSFFVGSGQDFQYVLSIAGLFMMGWAVLLVWCSFRPLVFNKTNRTGHVGKAFSCYFIYRELLVLKKSA